MTGSRWFKFLNLRAATRSGSGLGRAVAPEAGLSLIELTLTMSLVAVVSLGSMATIMSTAVLDYQTEQEAKAYQAALSHLDRARSCDYGTNIANMVTFFSDPANSRFAVDGLDAPVDLEIQITNEAIRTLGSLTGSSLENAPPPVDSTTTTISGTKITTEAASGRVIARLVDKNSVSLLIVVAWLDRQKNIVRFARLSSTLTQLAR